MTEMKRLQNPLRKRSGFNPHFDPRSGSLDRQFYDKTLRRLHRVMSGFAAIPSDRYGLAARWLLSVLRPQELQDDPTG